MGALTRDSGFRLLARISGTGPAITLYGSLTLGCDEVRTLDCVGRMLLEESEGPRRKEKKNGLIREDGVTTTSLCFLGGHGG